MTAVRLLFIKRRSGNARSTVTVTDKIFCGCRVSRDEESVTSVS
jgi:hypothetical protein